MTRTQYVVKLTAPAVYAGANFKWFADVASAQRFAFMTTALAHAVFLGLALDDFTVEAV